MSVEVSAEASVEALRTPFCASNSADGGLSLPAIKDRDGSVSVEASRMPFALSDVHI